MHPYFNIAAVLLVQEERLREAERHRRHRVDRQKPAGPRWWHWRGNRGPRRGDHTLAG
jgi:hypothetical protein